MKKDNKKKGQIAILIALSFSFLFLLFAMIVNIGFLVVAKINLQNSVDLAAYAGAAQQARYLTEIGKWNYEMRRIYKAFVYDYQIVFNAERRDFDHYIKQDQNNFDPQVCCSLQRRFGADASQRNSFCQFQTVADFTQQETTAKQYSALAFSAWSTLASSVSVAIIPAMTNWVHATILANQTRLLKENYTDEFANYLFDETNYPDLIKYNYNLRLLGWTLHDYRHMQARIRGVHTGSLNIENRLLNLFSPNYDTSPVLFKNAPISVAAKVINGYIDLDNDPDNISGQIISLDFDTNKDKMKNPVHNAAYNTFRKNLLRVVANGSPKLFHLVPKYNDPADSPRNNMGTGCEENGGICKEFAGPYLRLLEHNINFSYRVMYMMHGKSQYTSSTIGNGIANFPVGVAKDMRIKTYYALVAAARVTNIPFNVFFGSNEFSQNPALVAVAAAKPFGSRIGPYVNSECPDLTVEVTNPGANTKCIENGLDPLYPNDLNNGTNNLHRPNFSVLKANDNKGVKYTVGKDDYQYSTLPSGSKKTYPDMYYDTEQVGGRWRFYTELNNLKRDDGFSSINLGAKDDLFYDNDTKNIRIHPHGCRNSIMAWNTDTKNANAPDSKIMDLSQQNHYEKYLEYLTKGNRGAVYKIPAAEPAENRYQTVNGQNLPYSIYVFKYPNLINNNESWDINKLTKGGGGARKDGHFMEKSFANTMAVNEFEVYRYIIPNMNDTPDDPINILNWTVAGNKEGFIFAGNKQHESPESANFGNKQVYNEYAQYENEDPLDQEKANIAESYSSWRIGLRGYKVKLANIQEFIQQNDSFKNPLDAEQTISYDDETIKINLSEIKY